MRLRTQRYQKRAEVSAVAVVLVVDDEFGVANLLEDVLQDEGHRVLTASNGRQALERMAVERPDLIFTDYMMPEMDGAAMLSAMTANPDWKDIPVVLVSSLPEVVVAERCDGYATFLRKPFRIFDVIALVAKLVPGAAGPS
jgi:CheY-like chemotaxis protein